MNVALIGSVSSSFHCLDALIRGRVEITGVLGLDESKSAAVSGFRTLRPLAENAGLPFQPFVRVDEPAVERFLLEHPPDLLWVIGVSQLVPERLIRIARHGGVGFHPTMLPKGRGRAPVAWTILRGEPAAVSLFYLTDEPDAGDLIAQRGVPVLADDYSSDLIERTNGVLRDVVLELAPAIRSGGLPRTPQDHRQATRYARRTPEDGFIDWFQTTDSIYRLVRAAGRPYPGAFGYVDDRKVTIWRADPGRVYEYDAKAMSAEVGTILTVDERRGVQARTGDGTLWITEAWIEGALDVYSNQALAAATLRPRHRFSPGPLPKTGTE